MKWLNNRPGILNPNFIARIGKLCLLEDLEILDSPCILWQYLLAYDISMRKVSLQSLTHCANLALFSKAAQNVDCHSSTSCSLAQSSSVVFPRSLSTSRASNQ